MNSTQQIAGLLNATASALVSDEDDVNATLATRLIGAVVLTSFTVFSLTANLLLLAVFLRGNIPFKSSSFFTIASQMLVADLLCLSAQVLLAIPETYAGA